MDSQIAYGLLSLIQDRAAGVFEPGDKGTKRLAALTLAGSLLHQLKDPTKISPDALSLDVGGLLDQLDVVNAVAVPTVTGGEGRQRPIRRGHVHLRATPRRAPAAPAPAAPRPSTPRS
jgi:hypothetical protein